MTSALASDVVLTRLIDYLHLAGVNVDDALLFRLTDIVREGCDAQPSSLFDWSLAKLNGQFTAAQAAVPMPMPPLRRKHIGYNTHQQRPLRVRNDDEAAP